MGGIGFIPNDNIEGVPALRDDDRDQILNAACEAVWGALGGISHDGSITWGHRSLRRYGGTSDAEQNVIRMATWATNAVLRELSQRGMLTPITTEGDPNNPFWRMRFSVWDGLR
jgi:hypothetical protein